MNTSTKIATLNTLPANNNQCGLLKLNIHTATGGHIEINMPEKETVSSLKWRLSRKLKISSEKMSLLFKDRPLKEGSLKGNLISDNSKILLLPNMESGMNFQRRDAGSIQGLENLTESQVDDFLSGRAPLLLVMKLGDHMMFVQLQLSTASCGQTAQTGRSQCTADGKDKPSSTSPVFNSAALAQLGHNLSQKLREFSYQKASEHYASGPSNVSNQASVSKTSMTNKPISPTPVTTPVNSSTCSSNLSDTHNNHSHYPNSPKVASGNFCNPSVPYVTTPCPTSRNCSNPREPIPGAIIESMHHIGQGVYSGTFSGTLDPSLQDMDGKPKPNISTIIHILNDLLGATTHYRTQNTIEKQSIKGCEHKNNEQTESYLGLNDEDNALRGKVKDLQMKMEEKRMRRQARRESNAPYQSHGQRSKSLFSLSNSSAASVNFIPTINKNQILVKQDGCRTDADLSVFEVDHPECTGTESDVLRDEFMMDKSVENPEIEMTAVPTPASSAPGSTPSTAASKKPAETSAYTNSSLEQESVLV